MKAKFKFSRKENDQSKENEEKNRDKIHESETFNISELQKYYGKFTENLKKIEENFSFLQNKLENNNNDKISNEDLIDLETKENQIQFLEKIDQSIKDLKEDYKLNATFMSNYDQHNYMNSIENLTKRSQEIKSKIIPKKKFAFSATSNIKNIANEPKKEEIIESIKNPLDISEGNKTQINEQDLSISNKISKKIIISDEEILDKNSIYIENLELCQVFILFNFKALYIKNIKNCEIYVGSVSGGSHITHCEQSKLYLITHQLRIHKTQNTSFSIIVSSNPIIEDCKGLLFSSLKIEYNNYEKNLKECGIDMIKNKWNNVQDFYWHKREKSPNFNYEENNEVVKLDF